MTTDALGQEPKKPFEVEIYRESVGTAKVVVQASSETEAQFIALDQAGGLEYVTQNAEYSVCETKYLAVREVSSDPRELDPSVQTAVEAPTPTTQLPTLAVIAGEAVIRNQGTGFQLPDDWKGICADEIDPHAFWYVGRAGDNRSFLKLAASSLDEAEQEARIAIAVENAIEQTARQWDGLFVQSSVGEPLDIGKRIRNTYPMDLRHLKQAPVTPAIEAAPDGEERKFFETTVTVRVLSEHTPARSANLLDLAHEMDTGDYVGRVEFSGSRELTPDEMADRLDEFGSEPSFFEIERDESLPVADAPRG